jgi:hypothetical protein
MPHPALSPRPLSSRRRQRALAGQRIGALLRLDMQRMKKLGRRRRFRNPKRLYGRSIDLRID